MEQIEARHAKEPIKRMLLGEGGSAQVTVGNTRRLLWHTPEFDRPQVKLPWPLSGLQEYSVRISVFRDEEKLVERTMGKKQIDQAISIFLEGLDPSEMVLILPEHGTWGSQNL